MDLSDLLESYILVKTAERLKPHTISMYRAHLRLFIDSLPTCRRNLASLTVADVAAFLAAETDRGMGVITCRARHRAIDIWFNWISDSDLIPGWTNILRRRDGRLKLKAPRKPRHQPRRADLGALRAVIASIPLDNWIGLRDRAMLLLALDCGLRIGELTRLRLDDIDISAQTVTVKTAKGDKDRIVPFTPGTATALALYIMARPSHMDYFPALFWAAYTALEFMPRGPYTISAAQKRLGVLCQVAGVPVINWHSIRHHFGTKAINDGLRAETVSLLMGHTDPAFTRRTYAELLPATAAAEYRDKWRAID